MLTVYEPDSEMNQSDQITVPTDLWTALDRDHEGDLPIFVELEGGVVGRLRPAVPSEHLSGDSCRIPHWMWQRLGSDDDSWIRLTVCDLPTAGTLVLRARQEADVTGVDDPVAMLTAALSGSDGMSWACLSTGAELPLACGVFDVMEIRSVEDFPVPTACILDCDVNLEFVPALDRPVTPEPVLQLPPQQQQQKEKKGFIPFSGVGRRLCDP